MMTKEQREDRRNYFGGTDAAIAACGQLYDKTLVDTYIRMTGEDSCKEEPLKVKDRRYWGRIEPLILDAVEEKTEKIVTRLGGQKAFRCKDVRRFGALVDGIIEGANPIVVEAKNRAQSYYSDYGRDGEQKVLPQDYAQLQWYMGVLGEQYKKAYLAVLIGGNDFRILRVPRDRYIIAGLRKMALDFLQNNVDKKIPPAPFTSRDCDLIWPKEEEDGGSVIANTDHISEITRWVDLREQVKEAEKDIEQIKIMLKSYMGEKKFLVNEYGRKLATWHRDKTGRFSLNWNSAREMAE